MTRLLPNQLMESSGIALAAAVLLITPLIGESRSQDAKPDDCVMGARQTQLTEILSIGRAVGPDDYTFSRIADLTVSAAGDLWVLDAPSQAVKVYDSSGEFRFSRGRSGEGPGEFRQPAELATTDSSVRVFDPALGRMTEFGNDGEFLDSRRVPQTPGLNVTVFRPLRGGTSLIATTPRLSYGSGHHEPRKLVALRSGSEGTPVDTLLAFHSGAVVYHPEGERLPWGVTSGPFGPAGAVAVEDDSLLAVADGYASRVSLWRISPNGEPQPEFSVSLPQRSRTVEEEDVETLQAEFLRQREASLPYEPAFETPPRWSVATDALFSSSNELWIQNGRGPECSAVWTLIDLETRELDSVILPDGFQLEHLEGGLLYGVTHTELDVPIVRVYRWEKR